MDSYKYRGVIGLDLNDRTFQLKHRILGVQVIIIVNLGLQFHSCSIYMREDVQILA